jgi:uncharacterized protein (DUF433 family)
MDELVASFTPEQASNLTGVSPRQLSYWHRAGLVVPRWDDETRWLGYRRLYSFRDLVALRTLYELQTVHNVPLQVLRTVNAELQRLYDQPWATLRFTVAGKNVLFFDPETGLLRDGTRPPQTAFIFDLAPVINTMQARVHDLRTRAPEDVGRITRSRDVMGNAYVVAGTRIPTTAIWDWHEAGEGIDRIQRAYPSLQPEDIEAAVKHEQERRTRSKQKRSVTHIA